MEYLHKALGDFFSAMEGGKSKGPYAFFYYVIIHGVVGSMTV
jgi:hypothetical protein